MGQNNQQASDKLREAAGAIRRNRIPDRIRQNNQFIDNGWYDQARERERAIKGNIEEVLKNLQAAENGATRAGNGENSGKGDSMEDALNRARELADNLESLRRRMESQNNQGQQGQTISSKVNSRASKGNKVSSNRKTDSSRASRLNRANNRDSSKVNNKASRGNRVNKAARGSNPVVSNLVASNPVVSRRAGGKVNRGNSRANRASKVSSKAGATRTGPAARATTGTTGTTRTTGARSTGREPAK